MRILNNPSQTQLNQVLITCACYKSGSALGLVGSACIAKINRKYFYKNSSINHSHSVRECPDRDEPSVPHPFEVTLAMYARNNFSLDSKA